jgi:hypothetical protein
MITYAKAWSSKVQGAPATESFGNDPVMFVEVPLDIVMRYAYRAREKVHALHPA